MADVYFHTMKATTPKSEPLPTRCNLRRAAFLSCILLIPCVLPAESLKAPKTQVAAGRITVSQEKGRAVFSNDGPPAFSKPLTEKPLTSSLAGNRDVNQYLEPQPKLMYWSNTEHRYKPVPHASPMAIKAAKSAVAEVDNYVSASRSANTSLYSPSASPTAVDSAIEAAARRHNVDANLVRALIRVESNFNSHAVSRKGAMGLMQLMPSTARQLKVTNPFDPDQNVDAGVRHLKKLLQDFNGNVKLSLAAYNAGAGAVHRNAGIPNYAETRNYVSRITALYNSGDNSPFRNMVGSSFSQHYEPMRISRDAQGVLTVTNTD